VTGQFDANRFVNADKSPGDWLSYGRNFPVSGIATGSIIHTTLAAFGLSIIIAKSIIAFTIIKYAGAVYLGYIGYKMLTDRSQFNTEKPLTQKRLT